MAECSRTVKSKHLIATHRLIDQPVTVIPTQPVAASSSSGRKGVNSDVPSSPDFIAVTLVSSAPVGKGSFAIIFKGISSEHGLVALKQLICNRSSEVLEACGADYLGDERAHRLA